MSANFIQVQLVIAPLQSDDVCNCGYSQPAVRNESVAENHGATSNSTRFGPEAVCVNSVAEKSP